MKKYLPWIIGGAVLVAAIFLLWHSKKKRCKCKASAAAAAGSTPATTTTGSSSDTGATSGAGSNCGGGGANPPVLPAGTFDDGLHGTIPVYNNPVADSVYAGNPIL